MRIVQLITRLVVGGAQRVALETVSDLAARGHEVELWAGPESGPEGDLRAEAEGRGLSIRILPSLRRELSWRHDRLAVREIVRALESFRPEILHTHSSKAGIVGREAAARAKLARVFHTVHGFGWTPDTGPLRRALYVWLERRAAPVCERLVFVNPEDADLAARLGLESKRGAAVIPPGIDLAPYLDEQSRATARARLREELGWPPDAPVIGFLGRLSEQKAPEFFLEVAERLLARTDLPSAPRFVMVGDGPLRAQIVRRLEHAPLLAPRFHLPGLRRDAARWLLGFDLFLFPSRWEGAPLTLMEAMAAGRPILARGLPGVRFLAEDGLHARLLESSSATEWTEAAANLLRDPTAAEGMGARARAHALGEFSLPRMLEKLRSIYEAPSPLA